MRAINSCGSATVLAEIQVSALRGSAHEAGFNIRTDMKMSVSSRNTLARRQTRMKARDFKGWRALPWFRQSAAEDIRSS